MSEAKQELERIAELMRGIRAEIHCDLTKLVWNGRQWEIMRARGPFGNYRSVEVFDEFVSALTAFRDEAREGGGE